MNNSLFTVKRLYAKDIPLIEKCYSDFDFLHFNPMTKGRVLPVLVSGQVWGIFKGGEIVGCTYMMAGEKEPFISLTAAWETGDLLNTDMADLLVAGYLWTDEKYRKYPMYQAAAKLWEVYAQKLGKKVVLHYTPAHTYFNMERLFTSGYSLRGLRGLDKLVPHYIFTKEFDKTEYSMKDVKICPVSDTKEVSRLCELEYEGVALCDKGQNIYFAKRS